jgi:uncharacterized protein (TIGR02001 family)
MKKILVLGLASLCAAGVAKADYSLSTDFTIASDYIFRGLKYGDLSLQPSVEFTQYDFYAGIWAQQPLEKRKSKGYSDEVDLYFGYSPKLTDTLSLDLGVTHYRYPNSSDYSTEAFVGANYTISKFTPGIYAYYDFDLKVFTVQGNLGFSIPLDQLGTSLDLSASIGSASPDVGDSYVYYSVGASVPYKLNENATVKVGVNWATNDLSGADDNFFFYTVGLTIGF